MILFIHSCLPIMVILKHHEVSQRSVVGSGFPGSIPNSAQFNRLVYYVAFRKAGMYTLDSALV